MKCEDNRVMNVHDKTGKPVESSAHMHSARIWFSRTPCFCIFEREQVQSCNRRGKHRFQHFKRAERDGETITWHQRSQLDSAKHFKVILNIGHSIFSAKNQKMRLQLLGTLNHAR